jgi:hypothetical protein
MLFLSTKITTLPLLSIRTSGRIGTVLEPIINPHNLHIDGFYCQVPHSKERLVLLDMHIRDFSPNGIIIDDHHSLSEPTDLVRLKPVLDINFELENKIVLVGKKKVGKIIEYAVDRDSLFIQKLYTQPPVWQSINQNRLVFDRTSVIEVTDTHILVKGPEEKVKVKQKTTVPKFSASYSANTSLTNE